MRVKINFRSSVWKKREWLPGFVPIGGQMRSIGCILVSPGAAVIGRTLEYAANRLGLYMDGNSNLKFRLVALEPGGARFKFTGLTCEYPMRRPHFKHLFRVRDSTGQLYGLKMVYHAGRQRPSASAKRAARAATTELLTRYFQNFGVSKAMTDPGGYRSFNNEIKKLRSRLSQEYGAIKSISVAKIKKIGNYRGSQM